jgi:hypothetical protein
LALVTSVANGIAAALEVIARAFRPFNLEAFVARYWAQVFAHVVTSTFHVTAWFLATRQEAKESTQAWRAHRLEYTVSRRAARLFRKDAKKVATDRRAEGAIITLRVVFVNGLTKPSKWYMVRTLESDVNGNGWTHGKG